MSYYSDSGSDSPFGGDSRGENDSDDEYLRPHDNTVRRRHASPQNRQRRSRVAGGVPRNVRWEDPGPSSIAPRAIQGSPSNLYNVPNIEAVARTQGNAQKRRPSDGYAYDTPPIIINRRGENIEGYSTSDRVRATRIPRNPSEDAPLIPTRALPLDPYEDFDARPGIVTNWTDLQENLLPLVQQLMQTNNQLYALLSQGLRYSNARSGVSDDVNIDLEKGKLPEAVGTSYPGYPYDPYDRDRPRGATGRQNSENQSVGSLEVGVTSEHAEKINRDEQEIPETSPRPDDSRSDTSPLEFDDLIAQTQWLVPYGTFLSRRFIHQPPSVRSGESVSDRPYVSMLRASDYLPDEEIASEKQARLYMLNAEFVSNHHFCEPHRIIEMYSARYSTVGDESINVPSLAMTCKELGPALSSATLPSWQYISSFIPLIQERLLCCTGDPHLRLDACWDRRPRGTFLDFGWTRAQPDMPTKWSFFAHCKAETLVSILIEALEVVRSMTSDFRAEWGSLADGQAWKLVDVGSILGACYSRRLLIQPQPDDLIKYEKHVLYVLASLELINTCFKSRQVDLTMLDEFCDKVMPNGDVSEKVEELLYMPISRLASNLLCPSERISGGHGLVEAEVFIPKDLNIVSLAKIGSLRIEWTEYVHEHLKFDTDTMTVYIYWFASHLDENSSWHLYCDYYKCTQTHKERLLGRGQSRTATLTYHNEVMESYQWLFKVTKTEIASASLELYYDLPLPWWLTPLDQQNTVFPWHRTGSGAGEETSEGSHHASWITPLLKLYQRLRRPREAKSERATIRSLLRDINGQKCDLPVDCKTQLEIFRDGGAKNFLNSNTVSYSRFRTLAPRVKTLLDFMEKQKPRGFRALWRDKRDSNAWYTFWAAVIFGATALILAAAGLAVSSAQTWAGFRALELQMSSSGGGGTR